MDKKRHDRSHKSQTFKGTVFILSSWSYLISTNELSDTTTIWNQSDSILPSDYASKIIQCFPDYALIIYADQFF